MVGYIVTIRRMILTFRLVIAVLLLVMRPVNINDLWTEGRPWE